MAILRFIRDYLLIKRSGLFDEKYYLEKNEDVRRADINPLWHYVSYGWKEGRNPSRRFDLESYLLLNSDVREAEVNPLTHYLCHGNKKERSFYIKNQISISQSVNLPPLKNTFKDFLGQISNVENGIIFVSHDASKTGAPINLLNICKAYNNKFNLIPICILINGGALLAEFQSLGPTINLSKDYLTIKEDPEILNLLIALREKGYRNAIVNTIVSASLQSQLNRAGIFGLYLIHELPKAIEILSLETTRKELIDSNDHLVFAANFVAKKFFNERISKKNRIHIIPQAVRDAMIYQATKTEARKQLLQKIGVDPNSKKKLILGCGFAQYLKGTDLFIEVAQWLFKLGRIDDFEFIWLGERNTSFQEWFEIVYPTLPFNKHIHFLSFEKEPAYVFKGSDALLLTSRHDSYPSVALESLSNKTPVFMFEGTSGIEEILDNTNGRTFPAFNTERMANGLVSFFENSPSDDFHVPVLDYDEYLNRLLTIVQSFWKKYQVSVVVPNFNYAQYLTERLDSIINQSYAPFEIIFLDDASSDNSLSIAKKILKKSAINYSIVTNESNQGVFSQWNKGVTKADGELVWIAEADDVADKDFLFHAVKLFIDDEMSLGYCLPDVIDESSVTLKEYSFQSYVSDLAEDRWKSHYSSTGKFEIENFLAIKNIIPNVSGVLLKKNKAEKIIGNIKSYSYAGDWKLYIDILKEGRIGYFPYSFNHFRRHSKSVITSEGGNERFFREVLSIHQGVFQEYIINPRVFRLMQQNVLHEKNSITYQNLITKTFQESIPFMLKKQNRKLGVLIVLSEFSMGGGELTGVRLANQLSLSHDVYLVNALGKQSIKFVENIGPNVTVLGSIQDARELIDDGKIDIVNSHIWWGDKVAYDLVRNNNLWWILSMHGCYEMLMNNPDVDSSFHDRYKLFLKRADLITYDSEKNLQIFHKNESLLRDLYRAKKVYHGYKKPDLTKIIARQDLGVREDSFLFIMVARGIKEKGWEEAINAVINLNKKGIICDLLLIGSSEYVEELKMKFEPLAYIKFLGEQNNLQNYYHISDCGLLPTYFVSESQPLAIIEYLAWGLPVIATDIGEIRNMLSLGNNVAGTLLTYAYGPVNLEEISEKMAIMIRDPQIYANHKRIANIIFEEKFGIEKFAENYLSSYFNYEIPKLD